MYGEWDDSDDYVCDNEDMMEVLGTSCEDYDLCNSCYSVEEEE